MIYLSSVLPRKLATKSSLEEVYLKKNHFSAIFVKTIASFSSIAKTKWILYIHNKPH